MLMTTFLMIALLQYIVSPVLTLTTTPLIIKLKLLTVVANCFTLVTLFTCFSCLSSPLTTQWITQIDSTLLMPSLSISYSRQITLYFSSSTIRPSLRPIAIFSPCLQSPQCILLETDSTLTGGKVFSALIQLNSFEILTSYFIVTTRKPSGSSNQSFPRVKSQTQERNFLILSQAHDTFFTFTHAFL